MGGARNNDSMTRRGQGRGGCLLSKIEEAGCQSLERVAVDVPATPAERKMIGEKGWNDFWEKD